MTPTLPASPELTDEELSKIEVELSKHEDYCALNCLIKVDHLRRAMSELRRHRSSPSSAWPDFIAPPKYENAAPGWEDPRLPDFRLIWQTARECGYAIGLHGSMKRDVDLIAAPWTDEAAKPTQLINSLCVALNAKQIGAPEFKPQGRVAVTLQIDAYVKHIDLSIMPCLPEPPK